MAFPRPLCRHSGTISSRRNSGRSSNPVAIILLWTSIFFNQSDLTLTERFCHFLIRETTSEYFKWINDKKMVEKHCRAVVDVWEAKGYNIPK